MNPVHHDLSCQPIREYNSQLNRSSNFNIGTVIRDKSPHDFKKNTHSEFTFRKNDDIGAAAAEDDVHFLSECFIDTGELEYLYDCDNPKQIIVGRTGAGKTALLTEIQGSSKKTINLSPTHSL